MTTAATLENMSPIMGTTGTSGKNTAPPSSRRRRRHKKGEPIVSPKAAQPFGVSFLQNLFEITAGSGSNSNTNQPCRKGSSSTSASVSASASTNSSSSRHRNSTREATRAASSSTAAAAEEVLTHMRSWLSCAGIGIGAGGIAGSHAAGAASNSTGARSMCYDGDNQEFDDEEEIVHFEDDGNEHASAIAIATGSSVGRTKRMDGNDTIKGGTDEKTSLPKSATAEGAAAATSTQHENQDASSTYHRRCQCDDFARMTGGGEDDYPDDDDVRDKPANTPYLTEAAGSDRLHSTRPLSSCPFSISPYKKSSRSQASSLMDAAAVSQICQLQRLVVTGHNGTPKYGSCSLSQGQVMLPSGRWKFSFGTPAILTAAATAPDSPQIQPNKGQSPYQFRVTPTQMSTCELRIGGIAIPLFPRKSTVTLFQYDSTLHYLTVTIASPSPPSGSCASSSSLFSDEKSTITTQTTKHQQQNVVAVIAVLYPVSKRFCQAARLTQNGDTSSLKKVVQLLDEWAPTATFTLWSLGIPSTLMAQTLVSNLLQINVPQDANEDL